VPLSTIPTLASTSFSLRTVFYEWQQVKRPSRDTKRACEIAVDAFLELLELDDIDITTITKKEGQRFATHLVQQCNSRKTAHGKLTWVKSLLNFAVDSLECLSKNPFKGIDIKYQKQTQRRIWTDSETETLIKATASILKSNNLPKRSGGAAAYWLPLLAMYTGARLSELAQLIPSDITSEPDGYWLNITDTGIGQQIKSTNARRKIPIHPKLISAGLIEYSKTQQEKSSLWPELPKRLNKAGGYFSNWFGSHLRAIGLDGLDFHSFRHTFRTKLVMNGAPEAVIDVLMGHSTANNVGKSRYTHVNTVLRAHVSKIEYAT
jgi:integrase